MNGGDPDGGRALRPVERHDVWWRSLFTVEHAGHTFAVDVDHWAGEHQAVLYRDGLRSAAATMPASFTVPDGVIEVDASSYGMRRAHLVLHSGTERMLHPAPGTGEHWRADVASRRPVLSRAVAVTSVMVLLVGLGVALTEGWELVTGWDWVNAVTGTFTSPVDLPWWGAVLLGAVCVVASVERALRLRHHWLLDADDHDGE